MIDDKTLVASVYVCDDFRDYAGGIYSGVPDDEACENGVKHALLVYGYDDTAEDERRRHWKVQNSWGTDWGEYGLARIMMVADADVATGPLGLQASKLLYANFGTDIPSQEFK